MEKDILIIWGYKSSSSMDERKKSNSCKWKNMVFGWKIGAGINLHQMINHIFI